MRGIYMRTTKMLLTALVLATLAIPAFANDSVRVYGRLLGEVDTVEQKYAVATSIVSINDPAAASYFANTLDWALSTRSALRTMSERETYERLTRILLKSLGEWRYTNAADSVMRAVEDSPDALTKAEALIALGNMRAVEYAERISLMLRDLNNEPSADREFGEKIAYGCILALEKMRSPVGFAPLFFASEGWYSKRVRDQALRSLPLILDDPSEAVSGLIKVETPPRMIRALDLELRSAAPAGAKTSVAKLALSMGIKASPRNRTEQNQLSELRMKAMNALAAAGTGDGSTASDIAEAYKIAPQDERLVALKALGADKSSATAAVLRDIIVGLNADQLAGIVDETKNTLMRAALQNAAVSANKDLMPAIEMVRMNNGWSSGILSLASAAQKALQ
jgi:hypothetical protein